MQKKIVGMKLADVQSTNTHLKVFVVVVFEIPQLCNLDWENFHRIFSMQYAALKPHIIVCCF